MKYFVLVTLRSGWSQPNLIIYYLLANMRSVLNDDDLSEVASEVLAAAEVEDDGASSATDIEHKIDRLNDVRERLQELRSIVTEYEVKMWNHETLNDLTGKRFDNFPN